MSLPQVALRYAKALEEAAKEAGALSSIHEDMELIAKILAEVPQIAQWCKNNYTKLNSAEELITSTFSPRVSSLSSRMLLLLARSGRIDHLEFIPAAYRYWEDQAKDLVEGILETASPAEAPIMAQVKSHLEKRTGKSVHLENKVRSEILGGFRILWDNRLLDYSVRHKIRELRNHMKSL